MQTEITTRGQLAEVATAIFGQHWTDPLAEALGISVRSVQRWASGKYTLPDGLRESLHEVAEARARKMMDIAAGLKGGE